MTATPATTNRKKSARIPTPFGRSWSYSPDDADAFALTFTQPVAEREVYADRTWQDYALRQRRRQVNMCITEYDVLADE